MTHNRVGERGLIMKTIKKSRINYFGGASFWACEDNRENRKTLSNNGVFYWTHTFKAANGLTVSRLE